MKSKGKKNALRLQSMINRCKLLSLSDSDEEHKNKEEKTSQSKSISNPVLSKSRATTSHTSLHIRTRNNRSPFSHKLISGKRKRNCWSDIDHNRPHSSSSISIDLKESSSIVNEDYEKKNSKRYPQRMDCQKNVPQSQLSEPTKQTVKKADVSQDFYGDDEASDFFDSSLNTPSTSRVRRVKVRHFKAPITCPKYDLNTQTFRKRRKVT